jgi:cell wall-associated NlpC family hydrolase
MKGKSDLPERTLQKPLKQIFTLFFLFLLTLFSQNIFAKAATESQTSTISNKTTITPIPITCSSVLMSLPTAPIVVREVVKTEDITPAQRREGIVYFAESHTDWGFRYRLGNSSLDDGFDCSGFVRYVLDYFGIKTTRNSGSQFNEGEQIPVEAARPGDLVFFGGKKSISHVAMVVSNDAKGLIVVHSTCTRGIVKENITESKYWKPKLKDKAVNIIGL